MSGIPEDVTVVHFRCRTGAGPGAKVLPRGGVTVAVRSGEETREAAFAICSAGDMFNSTEGAKRALARLLSRPNKEGKWNTTLERESDFHFASPPIAADKYPSLGAGFDFIADLADAGCIDGAVTFAWAVAVHAALGVRGGSPENQVRLRETLSAVPRGVKVKPFPKPEPVEA
jgi:hypothetical protein